MSTIRTDNGILNIHIEPRKLGYLVTIITAAHSVGELSTVAFSTLEEAILYINIALKQEAQYE